MNIVIVGLNLHTHVGLQMTVYKLGGDLLVNEEYNKLIIKSYYLPKFFAENNSRFPDY